MSEQPPSEPAKHRRRPRYSGKNPRKFEHKYKELNPEKYPETIDKVVASGKTPAGAHRPIMVQEILEALNPKPGEIAVDATLGYGGHAEEILKRITPGGRLIGLDIDPLELPRTTERLRAAGFGEDSFTAVHSNFAGIPKALANVGVSAVNLILADLGVSSMQLDRPERGFSHKWDGPLDMRLNPERGQPVSALLARISEDDLADVLAENSDEPRSEEIARAICSRREKLTRTTELAAVVRGVVRGDEGDKAVRRVFQALRMAVNDEMGALEALLRAVPGALKSLGRVAILTFHSGEDRRVKKAFKEGQVAGIYSAICDDVIRPSAEEVRSNPRASSAKLRWAIRA